MTVMGLNLTDLGPDGQSEPLSTVLVALSCTAARLVQSPGEAAAARVGLDAMARIVGTEPALPEFAELLSHVVVLLDVAETVVEEAKGVTSD